MWLFAVLLEAKHLWRPPQEVAKFIISGICKAASNDVTQPSFRLCPKMTIGQHPFGDFRCLLVVNEQEEKKEMTDQNEYVLVCAPTKAGEHFIKLLKFRGIKMAGLTNNLAESFTRGARNRAGYSSGYPPSEHLVSPIVPGRQGISV